MERTRRATWVASLVALVLAGLWPDSACADDWVRLRDGALVRGEVTDYVRGRGLTIRGADGELRRVAPLVVREALIVPSPRPNLRRPTIRTVRDQVQLVDGTVLSGQILMYVHGQELMVRVASGTVHRVDVNELAAARLAIQPPATRRISFDIRRPEPRPKLAGPFVLMLAGVAVAGVGAGLVELASGCFYVYGSEPDDCDSSDQRTGTILAVSFGGLLFATGLIWLPVRIAQRVKWRRAMRLSPTVGRRRGGLALSGHF